MNTRTEIVRLLQDIADDASTLDQLPPMSFESLTAYLLDSMGYQIESVTQQPRDGEMDIIATAVTSIFKIRMAVECKRYRPDRPVDVAVVRSFYASTHFRDLVDKCMIVTTSRFTRSAVDFANAYANNALILIDRTQVLQWVNEALSREEAFANGVAFGLTRLQTKIIQRIENPDFSDSQKLLLPSNFRKSVVAFNDIPITLLKSIVDDPRHLHALSPRQFEVFIAELLDRIGFLDVVLTPRSHDGGKDVIASRLVDGIPITFYFECKKYAEGNKIQLDTLRALLGTVAHDSTKANIGVLVTTSTFTKGCADFIMSECRLDGKDYHGLHSWIRDYSRRFGFRS